ncbi:MAG: PEGA domain-containing protein [Parachlamydia sp.]|nr:PEGA domain-containing protein [Parachlamydia sp.]
MLLSCISLTSCASILRGTTQRVAITSEPSEAEITIDGKCYGHTPQIVTLKRKRAHEVIMAKEGYQTQHIHLEPEVSPMIAANLGWGALLYTAGLGISCVALSTIPPAGILGVSMAGTGIGMGSDLLLGGGCRLSQNEIHAPLLPR